MRAHGNSGELGSRRNAKKENVRKSVKITIKFDHAEYESM
jgi:hypothetical protein